MAILHASFISDILMYLFIFNILKNISWTYSSLHKNTKDPNIVNKTSIKERRLKVFQKLCQSYCIEK